MSNKKTLVLVDGSSYLYRAYHAMPDLRAVPGDPTSPATGAIRGMVNMMQALRKEVHADYAACVFDASGPTFRDAIYPEYKAQRAPMPDDLRAQIDPIHEVVRLLGWTVLAIPGVEADDVIGTLAVTAAQQGIEVIVSSGDKDLSQLVDEHITIIDTMNGKRRDIAGVTAEFGVPPSLMVDYQTLVGDAVDNVPGVPKVGPKTAAKWLMEYGSLDALMARAHEIKGVAGENLRNALGWLPTGRQLVTIKTDCDLVEHVLGLPALDAVAIGEPQADGLRAFYEKYGFKGLARALGGGDASATAPTPTVAMPGQSGDLFADHSASNVAQEAQHRTVVYDTILNWADFDHWLERLLKAPLVALDTETDSLDEVRAQIVGISFSVQPGEAAYIPLAHVGPDAPAQLPLDEVLARLKPWLEDPKHAKLGQHIKYDRHVFANHGIEVQGYAHDTMLQSYVLEVHKPHGLASLAERHTGRKGISYEDLCGKGAHQIPFAQVPVDKAAAYSCEDSDQTLDVHQALWPLLQADDKLRFIYDLEIASSEVLYRIERNGVLIDAATLANQSHELGQRILQLETEAYEIAGQPFNLSSPKQLGEIFFDKLGMPVVKKTATGARSTDEEVLEKLAEDYPLPAKLLEHRSLSKLKGTYTDKLAQLADPRTGRVHTHYAQAVAVTGRLSSNEPNLQNIPIRTDAGRRIRNAFVVGEGHDQLMTADYSQIEMRIMAHLSQDEGLIEAFNTGEDLHSFVASRAFSVPIDQVTGELRRRVKAMSYGLAYGLSAYGLAAQLKISTEEAKVQMEQYFDRFGGVRDYLRDVVEKARVDGYTETIFGRRRPFPDLTSTNRVIRDNAERAALNAPIQGSAADIMKIGMIGIDADIREQGLRSRMLLQVHDELIFEVSAGEWDALAEIVSRRMSTAAQLRVPLTVQLGRGENWDAAAH